MKLSKFKPLYDKKGNANFRYMYQRPGVYVIRENGKIVYIGHSQSNLYTTMYRHFQEWNHPTQNVTTYKGRPHRYTARVVLTRKNQAIPLEQALVQKYKPRDNKEKYERIKESRTMAKLKHEYHEIDPVPGDAPF